MPIWQAYRDWTRTKDGTGFLCNLLGLAGETGELIDLFKKREFHHVPVSRAKILSETGDVVFYLTRILDNEGLTLEEVILANKEKLDARYPEGFKPGGGIR